jgi:uncharacterized protein
MSGRARHVPLRRCVVCRGTFTKADLVRLVEGDEGYRLDPDGRAGGRGTWICRPCIEAAHDKATRRAFARAFRQRADEVVALLPRPSTATGTPRPHDARHGGTHG